MTTKQSSLSSFETPGWVLRIKARADVVQKEREELNRKLSKPDAKRKAMPPGRRTSKTGRVYYESRRNRSDDSNELDEYKQYRYKKARKEARKEEAKDREIRRAYQERMRKRREENSTPKKSTGKAAKKR